MGKIPLRTHGGLGLLGALESIRSQLTVTLECSRRTGGSGVGIRGSSCVPVPVLCLPLCLPVPVPLRMCLHLISVCRSLLGLKGYFSLEPFSPQGGGRGSEVSHGPYSGLRALDQVHKSVISSPVEEKGLSCSRRADGLADGLRSTLPTDCAITLHEALDDVSRRGRNVVRMGRIFWRGKRRMDAKSLRTLLG